MNTLILVAASVGLALAMLLVPTVFIANAVMLAAISLFLGASAVVMAHLVGAPVAH